MSSPAELALLVLGSVLSAGSAVCSLAGILELLLILGPVACCTTWWIHQLVLLVAWLPVLGLAGWQVHGKWQPAIAFVVLGAFFIFSHMFLLFCYWLRRTLRRQAAMELPTQQLLTEAHRMMLQGGVEAAPWGLPYLTTVAHGTTNGAATAPMTDAVPTNQFQLQVGRTDGVAGYTLYIPGEAEEAAIYEAAARMQQQRQQQAGQSPPQQHEGDAYIAMENMTPAAGSVPHSPTRYPGFGGSSATPPGSFRQGGGGHSRHSSFGGASGRTEATGNGVASGLGNTSGRGIVRVLASEQVRLGSGRSHRYRAFENMPAGSPAGSLRRANQDAGTAGGYVPPVTVTASGRMVPPQPMSDTVSMQGGYQRNAQTDGGSAPVPVSPEPRRSELGGLLESNNPLLLQQEYSLQYLPHGNSSSTPKKAHSRSPSGEVHATSFGRATATPAVPSSPLSVSSRQDVSFDQGNPSELYRSSDVERTHSSYVMPQRDRSRNGSMVVMEHDLQQQQHVSSSMMALIGESADRSNDVLGSLTMTPRSPSIPPAAPPAGLGSSDKPSSSTADKKPVDKKLARTSHRSKHSRTHSVPTLQSLTTALLEQTDSSADVPHET